MFKNASRLFLSVLLFAGLCAPVWAQGNVLVAYFSKTGHTKALAEAVALGAGEVKGTLVRTKALAEVTSEDLAWAQAVAVGCPVYMSNIPSEALVLLSKWSRKDLQNKLAAVFVTASFMSTGEEVTQINLMLHLLMKRMILVGGPDNAQPYGATAVTGEGPYQPGEGETGIAPLFVEKGRKLGHRLAEILSLFKQPALP